MNLVHCIGIQNQCYRLCENCAALSPKYSNLLQYSLAGLHSLFKICINPGADPGFSERGFGQTFTRKSMVKILAFVSPIGGSAEPPGALDPPQRYICSFPITSLAGLSFFSLVFLIRKGSSKTESVSSNDRGCCCAEIVPCVGQMAENCRQLEGLRFKRA